MSCCRAMTLLTVQVQSVFHVMVRGHMHISVLFTRKRYQVESILARYFVCGVLISAWCCNCQAVVISEGRCLGSK